MEASFRSISFLFLFLAFVFLSNFFFFFCTGLSELRCIDTERQALLNFKQDLIDSSNRLSSWTAHGNCCLWEGVVCHNLTGHVHELHLRTPYPENGFASFASEEQIEAYFRSRFGVYEMKLGSSVVLASVFQKALLSMVELDDMDLIMGTIYSFMRFPRGFPSKLISVDLGSTQPQLLSYDIDIPTIFSAADMTLLEKLVTFSNGVAVDKVSVMQLKASLHQNVLVRVTHHVANAQLMDKDSFKALSGLQFLLQRVQALHENGSKFSLADQLEPILDLMSSWKKLEFGSWPALLGEVQDQYEINVAKPF